VDLTIEPYDQEEDRLMMKDDDGWMVPEAQVAEAIANPKSPLYEESVLSPFEYLLRAFESHISGERDVLAQYRQLAETSKDPVVKLIMGVVLEDEERHHSLMHRLATRFKDDLEWSQTPGALPAERPTFDRDTYDAIHKFIFSERTGIHQLEELATRVEGLYGGLPTELLEMMVQDSQKHERLLRFLFRRQGQAIQEAEPPAHYPDIVI
jgi:rubrerythrin